MAEPLREPGLSQLWSRTSGEFAGDEGGAGIQQSARGRSEIGQRQQVVVAKCAQGLSVERRALEHGHDRGEVLKRTG